MAIEITGYGSSTIGDFPQAIVTALNEQGLFDSVTLSGSVIDCAKNGVTILSLGLGSGGKFTVKNNNDTQLWTYDLGTPTVGTVSKCGSSVVITLYNNMANVNGVTTIAVGKSINNKIFIMHHGFVSDSNHFMRAFTDDSSEVILENNWSISNTPYTRIANVCAYSAEIGIDSSDSFFRNFSQQTTIPHVTVTTTVEAITPLQFSLGGKNFLTNGYYSIMDDES